MNFSDFWYGERYPKKEENRVLFYMDMARYVQAYLNVSEMKQGIFRISDLPKHVESKLEQKIKASQDRMN